MATRATKLPSLPDPNMIDGINEDLKSFLRSIKEIIEVREGRRASDLDTVLTRRDLEKIGIDVRALNEDSPSYNFRQILDNASILYSYSKTMTGNETFVYTGGSERICFIDPGGANRNFNPSGSFPSAYKMEIVNIGGEIITFDSTVSAQNIGPGQIGTFRYSGSVWY